MIHIIIYFNYLIHYLLIQHIFKLIYTITYFFILINFNINKLIVDILQCKKTLKVSRF